MNVIEILRGNKDLSHLLDDVCDVGILPEFTEPQNERGHLTYHIPGKTFAKEASGSEYILLADGSIGYWGSEGGGGRIADNLQDFFTFVINCPYWKECLYENQYQHIEKLRKFADKIFEEAKEEAKTDEFDLCEDQQKLADGLGIELSNNVSSILMKFYHCANREPRFVSTYKEDDGSTHSNTGSLFDN